MFYPLSSSLTQANHLAQLGDWLSLQYTWSSGVSIPIVTISFLPQALLCHHCNRFHSTDWNNKLSPHPQHHCPLHWRMNIMSYFPSPSVTFIFWVLPVLNISLLHLMYRFASLHLLFAQFHGAFTSTSELALFTQFPGFSICWVLTWLMAVS